MGRPRTGFAFNGAPGCVLRMERGRKLMPKPESTICIAMGVS